jgi:Galactose oxidase, central domain
MITLILATTVVGSLANARIGPVGTRLRDGRVLIAGGVDNQNSAVLPVEIYDPNRRSFRTMTAQPAANYSFSVLLDDGRVLFGIAVNNPPAPLAEIYDPQTDRFTAAAPAQFHSAAPLVKLPDGRVIVGGGIDTSGKALTAVEIFNPATNTWSSGGNLMFPRFSYAAIVLRDGRVFMAGGQGSGKSEIFDPNTRTSVEVTTNSVNLPIGARLADGRAMVLNFGAAYILDESANTLRLVNGSLPDGFGEVVPLPTGKLLLVGGNDLITGGLSPKILAINPDDGSFTEVDDLIVTRTRSAAVLLNDGSVLIAGGNASAATLAASAAAEVFIPRTRVRAVRH